MVGHSAPDADIRMIIRRAGSQFEMTLTHIPTGRSVSAVGTSELTVREELMSRLFADVSEQDEL